MSAESEEQRQDLPVPPHPRALGFRARANRFCTRLCSRPWFLAFAAAVLIGHRAVVLTHDREPPRPAPVFNLTTEGIENRIEVEMRIQLRGEGPTVNDVRCVRDADTHARCVAEFLGDDPAVDIDVQIARDGQSYQWQTAGRVDDTPR
jgi:hypothetical protein